MKSTQIHFDDGEVLADLTVVKASYAIDLDHAALVGEALKETAGPADTRLQYERNARAFVVPSLIAGTSAAVIQRRQKVSKKASDEWVTVPWPITFETLAALPGDLVEEWILAVYELNPRWDPFREDDQAEREKKALASTNA
jgi:hypothetical protein